jgi:hypothetical protein
LADDPPDPAEFSVLELIPDASQPGHLPEFYDMPRVELVFTLNARADDIRREMHSAARGQKNRPKIAVSHILG